MRFVNALGAAVAALVLTVSAAPAGATIINLFATIDGAQETPPVATPATGTASITYNDVSNQLDWTITFSGLLGTINNAHFHGPAPVGVPAGVRVGIPFTAGVTADTLVGSAIISEAFETELLGQLWYINIHSTFAPGGEIRGQVIPEPGTLLLAGLGLIALAARRRPRHS
jgi:CHRD domain/PEP-CTERM motif